MRTSDRKLAFYAAIALKAIEFIIMLLLLLSMRYVTTMRSKLAEPWSDSTLSTATPLDPWSARQQTMLFSSDHMVVTTTGLLPVLPPRAHDISWLAPRHQLVRWPASLPSCSSRYPVLLARRANGSRNEIRLWAEVNTRSSTRGENRGPGPLFRSVVCHRADRLPQRGCSIQTSSYSITMPERRLLPPGTISYRPGRRPGARPATPRPGS